MSDRELSTFVQRNITSQVGQSVTLPCWTPTYHNISVLEWTRRNTSPQYVSLWRDGHMDQGNQISNYRNRVELRDREMRGGDLSLNVRDIQPSDGGIYECRFMGGDTRRRRRGVLRGDPISIVNLTVDKVQYIRAPSGHNVILPCRVSQDATVDAVEWTRPDLESEGYVFLLRDGIPDTTNQHPSFEDRVQLSDGLMSDGNLSLVLKNVTSSDTGTYECRLKESKAARRFERAAIKDEPVSIIKLTVTDSELADEDTGDEDDADTDEEKPEVRIPTEGIGREHYGVIACGVSFILFYAFILLWALIM